MIEFVEASNKLEAVTRLSALVGSPPATLGPGSKERKSLLIEVARGLDLDVNRHAGKPALAAEIALHLGEPWTPDCWSSGQTVTLVGLNRLLRGTQREIYRRRSAAVRHDEFRPARSKLEAVTRISSLSDGPPQVLGPGSKERKSVLTDLANALASSVDHALSKPLLAEALLREMGGTWDESCWSAGQTITLEGLNRLLKLGEVTLREDEGTVDRDTFTSPAKEAQALLAVVEPSLPRFMDGKTCVIDMFEAESRHWAQDEWRGFYFEYVALPALVNAFGGGPTTVRNTTFDYSLGEVWDLKCHGDDSKSAILNSRDAVDDCLRSRGFGLIVLSGSTQLDDGDFRSWHKSFRTEHGRPGRPRTRPATYQRRSKAGFVPRRLDAFFIPDEAGRDTALQSGVLTEMAQGRQQDGSPRGRKYVLRTDRAEGSTFHLASLPITP